MNERNVALESRPFLLVSDVHGRAGDLERTLEQLPFDVRYKCFLGDAVGYDGSDPEKALKLLSPFDVGISGNHDTLVQGKNDPTLFGGKAVESAEFHAEILDPDSFAVLDKFVPSYRRDGMLLFHGTPESENDYLFNEGDIRAMMKRHSDINIFFGGHLHIPRLAVLDRKTDEMSFPQVLAPLTRFELDVSRYRYAVTVPSLAYGRFQSAAGYCLVYPHKNQRTLSLSFLLGYES